MTKRIALLLVALTLVAPALVACGKKGPLDVPPEPVTKEQKQGN